MNYRYFFENPSVLSQFRKLLDMLPERKRYGFYSVVAKAYKDKQLSEVELPSFKLTKDDVHNLFLAYA